MIRLIADVRTRFYTLTTWADHVRAEVYQVHENPRTDHHLPPRLQAQKKLQLALGVEGVGLSEASTWEEDEEEQNEQENVKCSAQKGPEAAMRLATAQKP